MANEKFILPNLPSTLARLNDKTYQMPRHLLYLEKKLVDVALGKIKRLIVCMPPRHGKSEYTSKYFPAWTMINFPAKEIILTSYQKSIAEGFGVQVLDLVKNFGGLKKVAIRKDSKKGSSDFWIENNRGKFLASGARGPITGRGADIFIIDDPFKNDEEANSKVIREKTWSWFQSVAMTRLSPNGAMVIVTTRWHLDDLVGRILSDDDKNKDEWEVLSFPAFALDNDILGRYRGDVLWPDRWNAEELELKKLELSTYQFSSLYQQTPIAIDNQLIKEEDFQYYDPADKLNFYYKIIAWDTATKVKEKNDYSAGVCIGINENGYYLLDIIQKKMMYPELKQTAIEFYERNPGTNEILIEDANSGSPLIQELQQTTRLPVVGIGTGTQDKYYKMQLIAPVYKAGKVFLPKGFSLNRNIIEEHTAFPYGAHDDICDAFRIALDKAKLIPPPRSVIKNERKLRKRNSITQGF